MTSATTGNTSSCTKASSRRDAGHRYPCSVAGDGRCSPEDCGGVHGYAELRRVIADPDHEEHPPLQWAGGSFARDAFDPAAVKFDDPTKRWKKALGRRTRVTSFGPLDSQLGSPCLQPVFRAFFRVDRDRRTPRQALTLTAADRLTTSRWRVPGFCRSDSHWKTCRAGFPGFGIA